jgi:hypothetical protein
MGSNLAKIMKKFNIKVIQCVFVNSIKLPIRLGFGPAKQDYKLETNSQSQTSQNGISKQRQNSFK